MGSNNPPNSSLATGNYLVNELGIGKGLLCLSVIVCTLLGNMIIMFSYFQNYKMRTVTNTLVINNCLTDILLAMSDTAFYGTLGYIPGLMESDVFCTLMAFFDSLLKVASLLSMVCIALDRYINLVRTCRKRMTKERVTFLVVWVWLQSAIVAAPWNKVARSGNVESECAFFRSLPLLFEAGSAINALSVFFRIACILLPLLSVYYVSYRVFSVGRRRRRVDVQRGSSIRRRFSSEHFAARSAPAKITAMFLLGIYIICTGPFFVAIIWTMFPKSQVLAPRVVFAIYYLFRLKGPLFPIVYITRNRVVLNSVQELACCKSRVTGSSKAFIVGSARNHDWKRDFNGPARENGLNRRQGATKEPKILYGAKNASVKFDFTDLKRAKRSSSHISGTWI